MSIKKNWTYPGFWSANSLSLVGLSIQVIALVIIFYAHFVGLLKDQGDQLSLPVILGYGIAMIQPLFDDTERPSCQMGFVLSCLKLLLVISAMVSFAVFAV